MSTLPYLDARWLCLNSATVMTQCQMEYKNCVNCNAHSKHNIAHYYITACKQHNNCTLNSWTLPRNPRKRQWSSQFHKSTDFLEILSTFQTLCNDLGLDHSGQFVGFYPVLKKKLSTWRTKSLYPLLDCSARVRQPTRMRRKESVDSWSRSHWTACCH